MTRKVLLIDDDLDIQDITQVVIRTLTDWTAIVATLGVEGLEKARLEMPDIILLDITMPDIDGFQVFEQLRSDSVTQAIPVIVLTAKVLPSDRRRFAEMGVVGVITKPFHPATLCQQIAQLLG